LQVAALSRTEAEPFALEKAFIEHNGRVFRAAYRITGNVQDAEDVLQTVFLRLARRPEALVRDTGLSSYLYRAALNAALDVVRARRARLELDASEDAASGRPATPERAHESAELAAWLRQALSALPARAAEVFALRYFEDLDNGEIARQLGLSRVSVAVTLHRTRHRLQAGFRAWQRRNR
jgi:RNA polymerase sigma-70 factor (ECF subfamily)